MDDSDQSICPPSNRGRVCIGRLKHAEEMVDRVCFMCGRAIEVIKSVDEELGGNWSHYNCFTCFVRRFDIKVSDPFKFGDQPT